VNLSNKVYLPKGYKKEITQYLIKWIGYLDEDNSLADEIYEYFVKVYIITAEQLLRKYNVRLERRRKIVTQYLVKWRGFSDDQSIWISEVDIYEDLIKEYCSVTIIA
jgi:hypothetical protein